MKDNKGAIYMEPEEYEAYLKEQERLVEEAQAKAKMLAESADRDLDEIEYHINDFGKRLLGLGFARCLVGFFLCLCGVFFLFLFGFLLGFLDSLFLLRRFVFGAVLF